MQQANTIKKDKSKSLEERKIATFKSDALFYLITKAKQADNFSEYELGQQANAMIEFLQSYVKRMAAADKKNREVVMAKYRNATIQNPLFNDMEKEVVYAYVDNNNFITQFSIDTNWMKAWDEVRGK